MRKKVTQKPISLKIDTELLDMLDSEVSLTRRNRNWHINQAVRVYLCFRYARVIYSNLKDDESKKNFLIQWLREQFS